MSFFKKVLIIATSVFMIVLPLQVTMLLPMQVSAQEAGELEQTIQAQKLAWDIINNYVDPEQHLLDPYREDWFDYPERYEELKECAMNVTKNCTTQYEKIEAMTYFVADRVYYDHPYYKGITEEVFLNPYDVYTQKRSVCSGYARLLRTLLNAIDIPCMNIIGYDHEYNAAYDSEQRKWIFADATWCSRNSYTVDKKWEYGGYGNACFDLEPEEIAQLSNHEVYKIEGIADGDLAKYSLIAPINDWNQVSNWYLKITDIEVPEYRAVAAVCGVPVKSISTSLYGRRNVEKLDLSATKIERVEAEVFSDCDKLIQIQLPSSLEEIEEAAFCGCFALETIDLSKTKITVIKNNTFANCEALKEVIFPESLTQIDEYSFSGCEALETIDLSKTKVVTVKDNVFYNCESLKGVVFPSTLTGLGDLPFYGCTALQTVDLSQTKLTTLGNNLFNDCKLLEQVKLPTTLTAIGDQCFYGCESLNNIDLSNSAINTIGRYAFAQCKSLGNISMPSGLNQLGEGAFSGCISLLTMDLSKTKLAGLAAYTFASCEALENVYFPGTITHIGEHCFVECKSLNKIDLSETNTSIIETGAFDGCNSANIIKLPASLENIGSRAFSVSITGNKKLDTRVITPLSAEDIKYPGTQAIWENRNVVICKYDVSDFVSRMYTVALGRTAEPQGLNDWTNRLLKHEVDGAGIAIGFIMSKEFTDKNLSDSDYIDVLYRTFFDREADAGGKKTWTDFLTSGKSRQYVLAGFVNSTEFDALCNEYGIIRGTMAMDDGNDGATGIRPFVLRLYQKVLGRAGEEAGVNDWCTWISTGEQTPESAAKLFFSSEEYLNKNTSDESYVETLYQTFMDRASEADGKDFWMKQLAEGMSRTEVLEGFSRSVEFGKILESFGL